MSFCRRTNRHDAWIKHREGSEIGLPSALFENEQTLAEFSGTGHRVDLSADLEALPEPQFVEAVSLRNVVVRL